MKKDVWTEWQDPEWEAMTPEQQRVERLLFGLKFNTDPKVMRSELEEIQRYIRNSTPKDQP